ncbi:hypothetical protein Pla52nx_000643 [Stieleria varia]
MSIIAPPQTGQPGRDGDDEGDDDLESHWLLSSFVMSIAVH